MPRTLSVGDVVRLKKQHPCGETRWEIVRVGMDIKLRCLGCGRTVMLPRAAVEKQAKQAE